jgi:hypothetical protein
MLERERSLADAVDLEKKEEEFHLKQARVRASIRIADGRARAVDALAANLAYFAAAEEAAAAPPGTPAAAPPSFDFRVEPACIAEGLSPSEIAELETDLQALAALDRGDALHEEFWAGMLAICGEERERAVRARADAAAGGAARATATATASEPGLHASLDADVHAMLSGKSYGELAELEAQIGETLADGTAPEPEYWDAVLRRLKVWLARARVTEIHTALRERVAASLGLGGGAGGAAGAGALRAAMGWDAPGGGHRAPEGGEADGGAAGGEGGASPYDGHAFGEDAAGGDADAAAAQPLFPPSAEPQDGRYSPVRLACVPREDAGAPVVDAAADAAALAAARGAVRGREAAAHVGAAAAAARAAGPAAGDASFRAAIAAASAPPSAAAAGGLLSRVATTPEDVADEARARELRALATKVMGDDEEGAEVTFSGEVALESTVYWWHDKYRPRKPKYFNRVHTGYEWNKYNQTHYDHDNPPPKVVQGYKFNIFYPDLIDKTKAPSFSIMPDGSKAGETCILRIHAGPPYEDIAFKIVNKEWEHSHKRGFKCTFERGILHLYINFVRPRYRR